MGKCKYILELPGGGVITLPSGFETLEKSKTIDKLYDKYFSSNNDEEQQEVLRELSGSIKAETKYKITPEKIKTIILKNKDKETFYKEINNIIENSGSFDSLGSVLYDYLSEDKGKNYNKRLSELKQKLQKPRKLSYFQNIGASGTLGLTNLVQERYRVNSKNEENKIFGFYNDTTKNLLTFLKILADTYKNKNRENTIYGIQGQFLVNAWSMDDIVLYELNNDLSLFLGLFKREALKVDKSKLMPILKEINKIIKFKKYGKIDINEEDFDINKFFIGELENNKVQQSQLEKLLALSTDKDISKQIDQILNLVALTINPESLGLIKSIKNLFWQLFPETYGKNNILKAVETEKFISKELEIEKVYKNDLLPFDRMSSQVRDHNYSIIQTIEGDLYENSVKNIIPYQDIVKFPSGDKGVFALVTHIFKRGENVIVYGKFRNQYGEIERIDNVFKPGELQYRKLEDPISPMIEDEIVLPNDGMMIISKAEMNPKIVKEIISKGDLVNGNLVVGIYPNVIYVQTPDKKIKSIGYGKIKSMKALKASQLNNDKKIEPNKFVQINDGTQLTKGDYFLFELDGKKFYKKILLADDTYVYSIVKGTKGAAIMQTEKKNLIGLKDAEGKLTIEDILRLKEEVKNITRSTATMSSFSNKEQARPGDFFFFMDGNTKKYGEVLEDNKVITYNEDITDKIILNLDKLPEVLFFTDRDISTDYFLFTIRSNQFEISFKEYPDNVALEKQVIYVIPKNSDLNSIKLLTGGYANIGSYIEPEYFNPEKHIDITDLMKEKLGLDKNQNMWVTKKSSESNKFKRNLESLMEIKYFDSLDLQTKKELGVLFPGVYFSLYKANEIDSKIYRVTSVNEDKVIAHFNSISPTGKIITVEKEFNIDDLLNRGNDKNAIVGSIANLYIQEGNRKIGAVLKEVNKVSEEAKLESRPATNKAINKLIKSLSKISKKLDMEVSLVEEKEGNFKSNQKAKIETNKKGETRILINKNIGQTEDVVHEFLHLFLTPLRYKHPEIYHSLIQTVIKNPDMNITDAEEIFVSYVASKLESQEDFLESFQDMESFVNGLKVALGEVNDDYIVSFEEDPIELLKTPLMDLFQIDRNDISSELMNLGMVTTEPMMREWMKNNNIILNCS